MVLIINGKMERDIDSYFPNILSDDARKSIDKLLEGVDIYINEKSGDVKLYAADVWGRTFMFSTPYTKIRQMDIQKGITEVYSDGSSRYDLEHEDGTKYSIYM